MTACSFRSIICWISAVILPIPVFADSDELLTSRLTYQVNAAISHWDNRARADVFILTEKNDVNLPSTPFSLLSVPIQYENESIKIKEAKVIVSGSTSSLAAEAEAGILEVFKAYNVVPEIRVVQTLESKRHIIILSGLGIIAFGILAFYFANRKKGGPVAKSIRDGFTQVSSTLEESLSVFTHSNHTKAENASALSPAASTGLGDWISEAKFIRGLQPDSIFAILTDAYWCAEDSFGAYFWSMLSAEARRVVVIQNPWFSDYVNTLNTNDTSTARHHHDPSYLQPMQTALIDNNALTQFLRKNPKYLQKISKLRLEHLSFSAEEMLSINSRTAPALTSAEFNSAQDQLKALPSSEKRKLSRISVIKIKSIAEEEGLIALPNLTSDKKRQIPSLAWLTEMPKEKLEAIFESYSAIQLSGAWIGPQKILERLEECIPTKKLQLLKGYLESATPSRTNSVFIELHKLSLSGDTHTTDSLENAA